MRGILTTVVGLALAFIAGSALAQAGGSQLGGQGSSATASQGQKPGGFPVGALIAYPGLDFEFGYDDNLFLARANRRGSLLTKVSPYIRFEGNPTPLRFD